MTVVVAPPLPVKPVVNVRVEVGLDCSPAFPELPVNKVLILDFAIDVLALATEEASVVSVANCKLVAAD